jgi:hypothetical protein
MSSDLIVHAWDLARTAKVGDRLGPALCKDAHTAWKILPEDALRMPGMFTAAIKPVKAADAQTKMPNFLGRTA